MPNLRLYIPILLVLLTAQPALAETKPLAIGQYGDWRTYKVDTNSGAECFLIGYRQKSEDNYKRRDPAFVHIFQSDTDYITSFSAGYKFKTSEKISAVIDGHKFILLPEGETAWTEDEASDEKLLSAMRRGKKMIVKGISTRDTLTTDTYDLKGITAAYKAMKKACS